MLSRRPRKSCQCLLSVCVQPPTRSALDVFDSIVGLSQKLISVSSVQVYCRHRQRGCGIFPGVDRLEHPRRFSLFIIRRVRENVAMEVDHHATCRSRGAACISMMYNVRLDTFVEGERSCPTFPWLPEILSTIAPKSNGLPACWLGVTMLIPSTMISACAMMSRLSIHSVSGAASKSTSGAAGSFDPSSRSRSIFC
jgi:hypothetical protein